MNEFDQATYDKAVVASQEAATHMVEAIGDTVRGVGTSLSIYLLVLAASIVFHF